MDLTRAKRLLLGQPLVTEEGELERIPKWKALSTLSSDALSSSAYATDSMLFALAAFSTAALAWSVPVALAIAALLAILTASYYQTIAAYPQGGGAYMVAKENLGTRAGLIAAAALLIDYTLTVAVSVSAGMENIASAFPLVAEHKELFGALVIMTLMFVNLRGIRDSSTIMAFPTYFFVISVFLLIVGGTWKVLTGQAVPAPLPAETAVYSAVPMVLLFRAFASGCAALTGVEAISNSVTVFRPPAQRNAQVTLIWMACILATLFVGITTLAHVYGLSHQPDQTLISQLGSAIYGRTGLYYATQVATALILFLAANTAYTGFPRLASLLAYDRFLPRQFCGIGDRLVFSNGILGLSLAAILLIFVFKGRAINLIPLYAVGVFLSFTLSQAGMVAFHRRKAREEKKKHWRRAAFINGAGALATFLVLMDLAIFKFTAGAWMVVLVIPLLMGMFVRIQNHYLGIGRELTLVGKTAPIEFKKIKHTVIVPVSGIHQGVIEALQYALSLSDDVRACYVEIDSRRTELMRAEWEKWVPHVPFVVLKSPYRSVVQPIIHYVDDVEEMAHDDMVTVVIPEFVTSRWWESLLHNQTALFIRAALAFKKRKVVTSVRYHLKGNA